MLEVVCLALTMLDEARGEGTLGMLAVGDVVLNRTETDGTFDICKTVQAPAQFTGWDTYVPTPTELKDALGLAKELMAGQWRGVAKGALWYHAKYVQPTWAKHMIPVRVIGAHIFYVEART